MARKSKTQMAAEAEIMNSVKPRILAKGPDVDNDDDDLLAEAPAAKVRKSRKPRPDDEAEDLLGGDPAPRRTASSTLAGRVIQVTEAGTKVRPGSIRGNVCKAFAKATTFEKGVTAIFESGTVGDEGVCKGRVTRYVTKGLLELVG